MTIIKDTPFVGPAVWTRADKHLVAGVTYCISSVALTSGRCPHSSRLTGIIDQDSNCSHRRILTTLEETVNYIRSELLTGRGFALLRIFDANALDFEVLKRSYQELCSQLGELAPQNIEGDLMSYVTNRGGFDDNHDADRKRGHRGCAPMSPHTDSSDIVALLCIRPARSGGASVVCSSSAVYNEILVRQPEYLKLLCRGFHFDLTGKKKAESSFTMRRIPVFSLRNGQLSCVFNKNRIILGMKKAGKSLNDLELTSIEYLEALAKSDEFTVRFLLETGDILFLNNHYALHARDEYDDWPEKNRRRLLLRLWMNKPVRPEESVMLMK